MSEHTEQVLVMSWAYTMEPMMPELELLHAIPNGSFKSVAARVKFKREGLKAGFPDLHLPVARCGYHSLFIEMKVVSRSVGKDGRVKERSSRVKPEQLEVHRKLREAGNLVVVCWRAEDAQGVLGAYLREDHAKLQGYIDGED